MSHQPSSVSFRYYRNSLEREIRNNDKTFLRYHQEIWLLFEFDIRKFPISWKSLLPTAGDESKKIKLFVQPHTRKLLHDGEQFVSYFVFPRVFLLIMSFIYHFGYYFALVWLFLHMELRSEKLSWNTNWISFSERFKEVLNKDNPSLLKEMISILLL